MDASDLKIIDMGASVTGSGDKEAAASTKIETVDTGTFSMDYFKFGKGLVLYLYDGYGHAAYDTAPDYRDRLWQWFRANERVDNK